MIYRLTHRHTDSQTHTDRHIHAKEKTSVQKQRFGPGKKDTQTCKKKERFVHMSLSNILSIIKLFSVD